MIKRMGLVLAFTILASGLALSQSAKRRAYYNKEFKVGFKYPANWQLDDAKKPMDDEPGFTLLADVSPPERSLRGQLHQASATIAAGTVSEAACKAFLNPNGESTKPRRMKIGKIIFYKVSSSDGAAGSVGETDTYRTLHAGRCYEISLMTFRRNGVKPDRTVRMVDHSLDAIFRSFYFGK